MASLTGNLVAETYKALLKTIDNDILTASEKQITDGFGGGSNIFIDSQGFIRANKYKVTNGLATQFLKADGSLDTNTYLTSITGAQVTTALGYTPVTNQRTLTINGVTYNLTANRSWTVEGTAAVWGNIAGTLSNQTDLQNALNAKYNNPTGTVSQYIRGDGSIATFPTGGGGGGGGVSYYLNGSINQGTIGGVTYYEMNKVPIIGTGRDFSRSSNGYIASFLTDANDPALLQIPAGNWNFETYLQASNGGGNPTFYIELYKYNGTNFTLIASNSGTPKLINDGANIEAYYSALAVPETTLTLTDRLAVRIYVNTSGRTITMHTENGHLCQVITTFTTGLTALNGLTAQVQYLSTGTSGNDFNISSATNTHTFNLPTASAVNRGALSAADWTTFNAKQAQLDGTGFVKISGTTISYDNSTYLTTAAAASTYQRLDNIASSLFASATNYPNNNAVIAGLALKADSANPVFTGSMNIVGLESRINFYDENNLRKYFIGYDSGTLRIFQDTGSASRFYITPTGQTFIPGTLTVGSVVKDGGTASQFLKADGSIDSNTYVQSSALANYLLISTAASTYQRLDKMVSNLLPSSTEYPNSNAVINALALKADAANPVFTGFMTISGAEPRLYFVDTDNNPDYTIFIDSGIFYIYDQTAGATRFSIGTTGNINAGIGKSITAGSFIKDGGTASQFLKADGSIDSNTYVSSSALTNYLLISTATSTYQRLDNIASSLFASATNYPNNNAVIAGLALKADAANPVFTGSMNIRGLESRINFYDENNLRQFFIGYSSGTLSIFQDAGSATRFQINSSGNITTGINNTITSWGFVKSGGTSSQYLMADGSVSTLSGLVTGTGTTNNLPKWTSGSTLGNSIISDNGTNVAVAGNLQSARFYNTFVNSSNNSRNSFQSFNLNESSLTVGWIAADFGDTGTTSNRVVFGSGYGGKAIIGGHTGLLDNWASLLINPSGFGNVIIGATTDAGFKLDVNGTGRFSGSVQSQSINVIAGSTSGFSFAVDQQSTFAFGSTNGKRVAIIRDSSVGDNGLQFGYDTTDKTGIIAGSATSVGAGIDFYTFNGSSWGNRMRITSGGNVGIGTTASSYKFDVQNGSDFDIRLRDTSLGGTVGILFETANDFSGTSQAYIKGIGAGNSGVSQLIFGTAGSSGDTTATERMRITSAGNVGIGTTSPQDYSGFNVLHINGKSGSSGGVLRLTAFDNSSSANIYAAGSAINFNTTSAVPFIWYTQDSERMRITSSGNVLIGTSTDSGYKLLTNGNFAISTGSFFGVYGSIAASWSGSTIYPTLYSNAADRWIMHINPHISYTQNGVNGFTGSMLGATVRFASSPAAATFWDLGVGICNIGADNFGIGRAGTIFFRIANNAAALFGFSVTATGFFESSDLRLKTLIDGNPIINGIENLQAKLYEKNGKIELGYFAQDAELIMPYAVTKNDEGFLNLSYREVHTAKIARLEQRVAELEKQLNLN